MRFLLLVMVALLASGCADFRAGYADGLRRQAAAVGPPPLQQDWHYHPRGGEPPGFVDMMREMDAAGDIKVAQTQQQERQQQWENAVLLQFYLTRPPSAPSAPRVYPPGFFESTRPSQPLWTPPTHTDCMALSSSQITCTTQ